jgi:lysophospholipase L1-like esterase
MLTGLFLIEIFGGGWLKPSNQLNYLSVIRGRKFVYETDLYSDSLIEIQYTRDDYGLRGKRSFNKPEAIDILTIGGSTTDQRYITDGETWQDIIEKRYKEDGREMKIANAGIDGHTTIGHCKNFEIWFPLIPKLRPKYIIFYIGINDVLAIGGVPKNDKVSHIEKGYSIKDLLKANSILASLCLKLKGIYLSNKNNIYHKKISFAELQYTEKAIESGDLYELFDNNISQFDSRLSKLVDYTLSMGAVPIFVSQPSMIFKIQSNGNVSGVSKINYMSDLPYNGVDYYNLLSKLNQSIKKICSNQYTYIDLTNSPIWEEDDFYDLFHNSPKGINKVGKMIYDVIKYK